MKTVVSIPNDLFNRVERLAKRHGRSRSDIYTAALMEYVARHTKVGITAKMNAVCAETKQTHDAFSAAAARRVLELSEW